MIKVACIGDSITSGFTLLNPRRDSYPSLLQKMLGSNDTKRRNWDPEIFRRDYRKIVTSVHRSEGGIQRQFILC